jgi:hypothetical protein
LNEQITHLTSRLKDYEARLMGYRTTFDQKKFREESSPSD